MVESDLVRFNMLLEEQNQLLREQAEILKEMHCVLQPIGDALKSGTVVAKFLLWVVTVTGTLAGLYTLFKPKGG